MTTAAALVIGNEILSGKVSDTNTPLLIDELAAAGVSLQRIVIVGDGTQAGPTADGGVAFIGQIDEEGFVILVEQIALPVAQLPSSTTSWSMM